MFMFKRTSDQRRDYREKGEARARAQHDVLIRSLGKVAGETESEGERWKVKLIVFVGGTCGSVHVQSDVRLNSKTYTILLIQSIARESGRLCPKMTSSDGSLSSPSSSSSRCWLVSSLLEACFSSCLFEVTAQSPIRLAHFGDVEVLSPEGRHDAYSLALVGVADGVFCGRVGRFMPSGMPHWMYWNSGNASIGVFE